MASVLARCLGVGGISGVRQGDLVNGLVQPTKHLSPKDEILAPIPTRTTPSATNTQEDLAATLVQFFGDLTPCISAAYNQYRARWQVIWISITARMHLNDMPGEFL